MLIRPRPVPPYWPAYPEPERSALEASYREEERKWRREAHTTGLLNLLTALIGPLGILAVVWAFWLIAH